MKNVFFALAFMLIGTFTFANNVEVETIDDNVTIENIVNLDQTISDSELDCGFTVTFVDDYGSTSYWEDCSFSGGFGDFQYWLVHITDWLSA